jgi:DNA mismatch repair ATPase MutL
LNSYNDEYEKILHTKLEILNLIIQNDFDFFKSVIKDKFDLTEEEVLLMYYQEIYEYIKSLNIDKGSNVYSTLLEVLESLQSEKDSRIFENLIKEISEYLEMDKINENE